MFKLSVEHIALFILAAFLLDHLTRSCGCANSIDGFNVIKIQNVELDINEPCQTAYNNCICKLHKQKELLESSDYRNCQNSTEKGNQDCEGEYWRSYTIDEINCNI